MSKGTSSQKGKPQKKVEAKIKVKEESEIKEAVVVSEPKKEEGLVTVKNMTDYFHVQRSTELRINSKETKRMLDDGWLRGMIRENLFKLI